MNLSRRILLPLLALAVVGLALPASATVARFLSLEEHVALSQLVVRARAAGARNFVSEKDGRPRTERFFKILETNKGSVPAGGEIAVRQMRGVQGEGVLRIPGDPELSEGEEAVLFLTVDENGVAYLTALAQSKYIVTRDVTGAWASRDLTGLAFTFAEGGRVVEAVKESPIALELRAKSIRAITEKN